MLSPSPLRALPLIFVTMSLVSLPSVAHAGSTGPGVRILFVGNSYTGASAPNHLGASYRELLLEAVVAILEPEETAERARPLREREGKQPAPDHREPRRVDAAGRAQRGGADDAPPVERHARAGVREVHAEVAAEDIDEPGGPLRVAGEEVAPARVHGHRAGDGTLSVTPANEYDGDVSEIVHEVDPFAP